MEGGWLCCFSKSPNSCSQFQATGEIYQLLTSPFPATGGAWGMWRCQFPRRAPQNSLIQIPSGISGSELLCRAGEGPGRSSRTLGGFGLCRAAALRGDRWHELLLFNVFPPWHCPDRKQGREPMPKLCLLSIMKNS